MELKFLKSLNNIILVSSGTLCFFITIFQGLICCYILFFLTKTATSPADKISKQCFVVHQNDANIHLPVAPLTPDLTEESI